MREEIVRGVGVREEIVRGVGVRGVSEESESEKCQRSGGEVDGMSEEWDERSVR